MKVALAYDRVNKWGGAERVLLALHELYPDAPLYTSVYLPQKAAWAKVFPRVVSSFLQKIPHLRNYNELFGWLTPIAFETFNFDEYDIVISVTSEAAKGIITKPKTLHICYCLTPTRYLWSAYHEYLKNPPKTLSWIPFYRHVSRPFLQYAKYWDRIAAQRPDVMVGISTAVQTRIKKYYRRNSELIYPPVDLEKFVRGSRHNVYNRNLSLGRKSRLAKRLWGRYYLIVSRLVPYKKVDLAIKAFNELRLPLVIVGTGSEEERLKKIAKRNITFVGFVKEEELPLYYWGAKGFIFPQEEDFGIVAVEAQASGVPVIAYKSGGALDIVIEGKTGLLFEHQTVESLVKAVRDFEGPNYRFDAKDCLENAKRFSKQRFKSEFKKLVEKYASSYLK